MPNKILSDAEAAKRYRELLKGAKKNYESGDYNGPYSEDLSRPYGAYVEANGTMVFPPLKITPGSGFYIDPAPTVSPESAWKNMKSTIRKISPGSGQSEDLYIDEVPVGTYTSKKSYGLGLPSGYDASGAGGKKELSLGVDIPKISNPEDFGLSILSNLIGGSQPTPRSDVTSGASSLRAYDPYSYTPFRETPQGKSLIEALGAEALKAKQARDEEMNRTRMQLQDYLTKQEGPNFLPVAALVDTWTGSNMARYFKEDQDKTKEIAAALQGELLKYSNDAVRGEQENLRAQLEQGGLDSRFGANIAGENYRSMISNDAEVIKAMEAAKNRAILEQQRRDWEEKKLGIMEEGKNRRAKLGAEKRSGDEERRARTEERAVSHEIANSEEFKSLTPRMRLLNILDEYEQAVHDAGGYQFIPGELKSRLSSIYNRFAVLQKEADNLGALTKSDLGLVWSQIPDATSAGHAISSAAGLGGEKVIFNGIDRARQELIRDHDLAYKMLTTGRGNLSQTGDKRIEEFNKTFKDAATKSLENSNKIRSKQIGSQSAPDKPDLSKMTLEEKRAYLRRLEERLGGKK